MTPEFEALRSNRAVIISVIAAAVSISILSIVGVAVLLGWVGGRQMPPTPVSIASPAQQVTGIAPGVDLIPGETLVTPAGPVSNSAPAAPAVAARTEPARAEPAARPRPVTPTYSRPREPKADHAPPKPLPAERVVPNQALEPRHPTDAGDDWPRRASCRTCGSVSAIATFTDFWDVRVRFDDGGSLTVRYPAAPGYRIGDRVRLANGRLVRE